MGLTKKWRRTSVKTDLFLSTFYLQTKLHAPLSAFFASPSTSKERYLSLGGHLRPWGCISGERRFFFDLTFLCTFWAETHHKDNAGNSLRFAHFFRAVKLQQSQFVVAYVSPPD